MKTKAETQLSRAIQDALEMEPGCHFERVQSGSVRVKRGYMHCARKGTADLLGVVRGGRFVAIEVKVGKGKQTEEQTVWANLVVLLGGSYIVARSVEDAVAAVRVLV